MLLDFILGSLNTGGVLALVAIGLNLQYGVARVLNLAYGEFMMLAGYAAFFAFTNPWFGLPPPVTALVGAPVAFASSWLLFRFVLHPLLSRSPDAGRREVDSILSTFGLLFLLQGIALVAWTSLPKTYSFLSGRPVILGIELPIQGNRLLVVVAALALSAAVFAFLRYSTAGRAMRAIAVSSHTAPLVGIDVARYSALAFAIGGALAATAGILLSTFIGVTPGVGGPYTLDALIVIVMGGIGNVAGGVVAALILGMAQELAKVLGQSGLGTILTFAIFSVVLLWRPQGLFGGGARIAGLRGLRIRKEVLAVAGLLALLALPLVVNIYWLQKGVDILTFVALATAWAFFSGPTRYVSLAASAFYGLGAYCVAVLAKGYSYPVALLAAVAASAGVAVLVGLATLRLSGMYFVIFTFGLASLVSAAVIWWDYNVAKSAGWYPDLPFTYTHVYYQLLVLCVVIVVLWLVRDRTRMGLALKTLGADETVARQIGIDTVALKVGTFVVSSVVMTLAGAIRNSVTYQVQAEYVFNPEISFITVIAALLGGASSVWGPMLGVVPLLLLQDFLRLTWSSLFGVILGAVLLGVVFFIPNGLIGLVRSARAALGTRRLADLLDALARRLRGGEATGAAAPAPPRAPSAANGAAAGHALPRPPGAPERKAPV
jgi:branched-chain amino acid transport system permease protein